MTRKPRTSKAGAKTGAPPARPDRRARSVPRAAAASAARAPNVSAVLPEPAVLAEQAVLPEPAATAARDVRMLLAQVQALEFESRQKDELLAKGFQQFNLAADKLGKEFQRTREQVDTLKLEVEQKNRALDEKNQELERNLFEKEKVKNYLASIFESLPVGVLVTDLAGGITSVNRAGQAMIGADAEQLIGERVNALLGLPLVPRAHPAADPAASPQADRAAPSAAPADPISFQRRDGELLKLQVSVTGMRGEGQQTAGYVVNVQDVTLLKKLEEHAERRNRFTVMGEMAANIAHEIRNPLGSIELFASLVRKGLDDQDEKMALMSHISSAITSMNHIISNVLEYTKPRAASLLGLDLHGLLKELDGFFRFMAMQNGVELELALEAPQPWIRGDRELLKQVFHNLLLNAVQAMPEGGTLTLGTRNLTLADPAQQSRFDQAGAADWPGAGTGSTSVSRGGEETLDVVQVSLKDTGAGMPPEVLSRIFDPFYTTKSRGTGLGLAIVHNIVEAHHGTIDVESQQNQGTTFVLMFPRKRE